MGEAADRFAEAVSAASTNAQYRIGHAEALWWSGDREASLAEYAEAARLSRTYEGEYLRVLELADRDADAVRFCEDTLSSQPERADVRTLLADLLYRQGDYAGALPHYESLATLSPNDPALLATFGYALQQSGEAERAVSVFRQALDVAPSDPLLRSHLAEGLYDTGAVREAIEVVQQGMDAGATSSPVLQRELGSLLERSGRRAEAARAYAAYARLAPDAQDTPAIAARAERLGRGGPS